MLPFTHLRPHRWQCQKEKTFLFSLEGTARIIHSLTYQLKHKTYKEINCYWRWQALRWLSGLLWSRVYPFWQNWQWRPVVWCRHFKQMPPLTRPDCWYTAILNLHLVEWPLHSHAGRERKRQRWGQVEDWKIAVKTSFFKNPYIYLRSNTAYNIYAFRLYLSFVLLHLQIFAYLN